METITDWLLLWEQLSHAHTCYFQLKNRRDTDDSWLDQARDFDDMIRQRWKRPDSSRTHMINFLQNNPGSTVLDIGAGTGAWSLLMATYATHVTALEPSASMRTIITEKVAASGIKNITIAEGRWPEYEVPAHDIVFASHSMYGTPSLKAFVSAMEKAAVKACFMLMRVPASDGLMAKAAMHVWGQPYDSPNFQVAYNALLHMGIYPDVLMETGSSWKPWTSESFDKALDDLKKRLNVTDTERYDKFLSSLLFNTLKKTSSGYTWPVANGSALIHWQVKR